MADRVRNFVMRHLGFGALSLGQVKPLPNIVLHAHAVTESGLGDPPGFVAQTLFTFVRIG